MDLRAILVNVYLSQSLLMIIGTAVVFFQPQTLAEIFVFSNDREGVIAWTLLFTVLAVLFSVGLTALSPHAHRQADAMLVTVARQATLGHLILISCLVGVSEELLFRGALQYALGPYWTSLVFVALHLQYLRYVLLSAGTYMLSLGLGLLYEHTGTLWSPIAAHALFDFCMLLIMRYDIGGFYGKGPS